MLVPLPPVSTNDEGLLEAWRGGDREAGARLLARHYDGVAGFFAKRVRGDAEDLVQATFLGCVEAVDRFRGEASFRTLLFAIARNKLLKHLRGRSRGERPHDPSAMKIVDSLPSSVAVLTARKQRQLLLEALGCLPEDTRLMLELFYWEGMPVRAIAEVVGRPVNTVKTRMARGRKQLAQRYVELSGEGRAAREIEPAS